MGSSDSAAPVLRAWQPFTGAGLAAFARASLNRVLLVQLLVAFLVAGAVAWFLGKTYVPVTTAAVRQMPEGASIEKQRLKGLDSRLLAEGKILAVTVDLELIQQFGQTADFQLELAGHSYRICSLFGCCPLEYPEKLIRLDRDFLEPWWGAWRQMIVAGIGLVTVVLLLLLWSLFSTLYYLPLKLIAFFADRELTYEGSWRMAGASQMPGAVFLALAIVLYGLHWVDLIRFLVLLALHLVIGWIYLFVGPFWLPAVSRVKKANPFSHGDSKARAE